MKTSAIAVVALVGVIFVECVVFAWGDVDNRSADGVYRPTKPSALRTNIATRVLEVIIGC